VSPPPHADGDTPPPHSWILFTPTSTGTHPEIIRCHFRSEHKTDQEAQSSAHRHCSSPYTPRAQTYATVQVIPSLRGISRAFPFTVRELRLPPQSTATTRHSSTLQYLTSDCQLLPPRRAPPTPHVDLHRLSGRTTRPPPACTLDHRRDDYTRTPRKSSSKS
jgi:hypothetical protein